MELPEMEVPSASHGPEPHSQGDTEAPEEAASVSEEPPESAPASEPYQAAAPPVGESGIIIEENGDVLLPEVP